MPEKVPGKFYGNYAMLADSLGEGLAYTSEFAKTVGQRLNDDGAEPNRYWIPATGHNGMDFAVSEGTALPFEPVARNYSLRSQSNSIATSPSLTFTTDVVDNRYRATCIVSGSALLVFRSTPIPDCPDDHRLIVTARSNTPMRARLRTKRLEVSDFIDLQDYLTTTVSPRYQDTTGSITNNLSLVIFRTWEVGDWVEVDRLGVFDGAYSGDYFDPNTVPRGQFQVEPHPDGGTTLLARQNPEFLPTGVPYMFRMPQGQNVRWPLEPGIEKVNIWFRRSDGSTVLQHIVTGNRETGDPVTLSGTTLDTSGYSQDHISLTNPGEWVELEATGGPVEVMGVEVFRQDTPRDQGSGMFVFAASGWDSSNLVHATHQWRQWSNLIKKLGVTTIISEIQANDAIFNMSDEDFEENYRTAKTQLTANGHHDFQALLMPNFPQAGHDLTRLRAILLQLETEGVLQKTLDVSDIFWQPETTMGPDGIHLLDGGNEVLAQRILQHLLPRLPSDIGYYATELGVANIGWARIATLANETLIITPRYVGQEIRLGSVIYTANQAGVPMRVYGTGPVEIGTGFWAGPITVAPGNYQGPGFSGSTPSLEYMNQTVYPRWNGQVDNSSSSFEYYAVDPWETTASWSGDTDRIYTVGVDRGMVYVDDVGHSWSGLTAIKRKPTGGNIETRYLDGVPFDVTVPKTDYYADLECYTYPEALDDCLGNTKPHGPAITVTGQSAKRFDFCYRTLVGDGTGHDTNYVLNFVYGAYAKETGHDHATINETPESETFGLEIRAVPPRVEGIRPTSYFQIDSRTVNRGLLAGLEKEIYGADGSEPRLPPIQEIVDYLYPQED